MRTPNELYSEAVERWGKPSQLIMGMEECAELQKEICKVLRGDDSRERMLSLAEEIADVRLMCDQIEKMYSLWYDVEQFRIKKLERLEKLLNESKQG
jgi:uncharacterized membrane protein YccC